MDKKIGVIIAIATVSILAGGLFMSIISPPPSQEGKVLSAQDLNGEARNSFGNKESKVTVVEFADFQCPACASVHPYIKEVLDNHKDNVYYIFRHFPLSIHRNAFIASESVEAAAAQGKFLEMADKLYEKQSEWENEGNPIEKFSAYAKEIGLNQEQFKKELEEHKYKDLVQKDLEDAIRLNLPGTPSIFINGEVFNQSPTLLKTAVESKLN